MTDPTTATNAPPIWEQLGPGLHRGISDHDYHVEPLASQSVLKPLANGKSPAHVLHRMLNPEPPSPAMLLGSAFHALVLQHGWHDRVFIAPTNDRRTKGFKEFADAIAGSMPDDGIIITPDELEQLEGMAQSVQRCHSAWWPIQQAINFPDQNYTEAMGLWLPTATTETPAPSWCKFKPDVFIPEHGIVVDLKTTQDADRKNFERSIYNFGYHLQAGFYFEGLRRLGFKPEYYLIIAIEKEPPYGVRVYNLEPEVIDYGWELLRQPLRTFSECMATGNWPAWNDQAEDIGLAPGAMKEAKAFKDPLQQSGG